MGTIGAADACRRGSTRLMNGTPAAKSIATNTCRSAATFWGEGDACPGSAASPILMVRRSEAPSRTMRPLRPGIPGLILRDAPLRVAPQDEAPRARACPSHLPKNLGADLADLLVLLRRAAAFTERAKHG